MRIRTRPRGARAAGLAMAVAIALTGGMARAQAPALPASAAARSEAAAAAAVEPGPGISVASASAPTGTSRPRGAPAQSWLGSAGSFEERIDRTRRAALEVGAWNLDPAARALIRGASEGTPLERARGAVRLAPDLPAARIALARALWIQEDAPMDAVRSVVASLLAVGHHTEASLWLAGSGLYVAAAALVGGGLLAILLAFLACAPSAAHDLTHLLRAPVPAFVGYAALAVLLLLPLVLGEGLLGLGVSLLVVAMFYGGNGRRLALGLAAAAVFCGLHPLPRLSADLLSAFPADPVAQAAYSTAQGLASPVDLARLEHAAENDPLAAQGLAIHARQVGNLGRADGLYQELLAGDPNDLTLINNAANVRLDLGHMKSALDLYDRAVELERSPVVLFNISQAYGRSFQVEQLNRALAEAQEANGELVADFTALQRTKNENFVVDLPLSPRRMWVRAIGSGLGEAAAAEFRRQVAPGRLGASSEQAAALLGLAVGVAWLLAMRFEPSGGCMRCGRRQCRRCGHAGGAGTLCESCTRLFYQPEKTDRALRTARIEALKLRERRLRQLATLGSVVVPGAAGFLVQRPVRGLVGSVCFALVVAAAHWREGVVPDPLLFGAAAPIAFLGAATLAGFVYFGLVGASVASQRGDSS